MTTPPQNQTELEKVIEHWELKLEPVEREPLGHHWATEITAQDLRLFVDAAKRFKEVEKERDELKKALEAAERAKAVMERTRSGVTTMQHIQNVTDSEIELGELLSAPHAIAARRGDKE